MEVLTFPAVDMMAADSNGCLATVSGCALQKYELHDASRRLLSLSAVVTAFQHPNLRLLNFIRSQSLDQRRDLLLLKA